MVFFYHGSKDEQPESGRRHVRLAALALWDHDLISSPRAKTVIERTLMEEKVDIAHVSLSFSLLDFSLPQLCHSLSIPIIATFHVPYDRRLSLWGIGSRLLYNAWSIALAKYDAVVIFSQEQRDILGAYGVPVGRIHVIPNGVDVDSLRPGPSRYKEEIGAELLIVYCGRLDPEKNVGTLLQAFQKLQLSPSHKAVIIGNGIEYERLRNRYASETIIFTGLIGDKEELIRVLRACDIFVLPSNVEGLSIAMLEGMACGMATIATDVGCDAEALSGAGIVIDPANLESQLDVALRVLIENPDLRGSLGKKARQRVMSRYSLHRNIDQIIDLYQQLIAMKK